MHLSIVKFARFVTTDFGLWQKRSAEVKVLSDVFSATAIDPWFLCQIKEIIDAELMVANSDMKSLDARAVKQLKRDGFSDSRLSHLLNVKEQEFRDYRKSLGVNPVYKRVDSCAAEFASDTAYMYSTYEQFCESNPSDKKKIMVLGGGPKSNWPGYRV